MTRLRRVNWRLDLYLFCGNTFMCPVTRCKRAHWNLVSFPRTKKSSTYISLLCRRPPLTINATVMESLWLDMTDLKLDHLHTLYWTCHNIKSATWSDINPKLSSIQAQFGMDNECRVMFVFNPGPVYADTPGRIRSLASVLSMITSTLNAGTCLKWKAGFFFFLR